MFVLALALSTLLIPEGDWPDDGRLKAAANRGDKQAAYELGRRYEAERGGHCNAAVAKHWYELAARDSFQEPQVFYTAPVGTQKYGRMVRLGQRLKLPGLTEAKERLNALRTVSCSEQVREVLRAEGVDQKPSVTQKLP